MRASRFWLLVALVLTAPLARAAEVSLLGVAGGAYSVKVKSLKELFLQRAFKTTIRQQYDFSCGSAALATLLTFNYNAPVSEQSVFQFMYANGNQEKIRREGFSLLDMKLYLESRGYLADGFEAGLDQLAKAKIPAIVLLQDHGYNHFVVVKGFHGGQVLVGDPAVGSRVISLKDFEARWPSRIVFVIRNKQAMASFNSATDWDYKLKARLGDALSRESLALVTLMRPTADQF
jgi:predicted double-glycine peptidase